MAKESTGRIALSENKSKALLKEHGIPVVNEQVTENVAETEAAAEKIGFPVVVKGLGASLLHKTEAGLVHLNL